MESTSSDSLPYSQMKTVHVIFITHCETEENVKTRHLCGALQRLRNLRMPTLEQCSNSLQLAAFDINSKPTDLGQRQIKDMALTLQEVDFWSNFPFDICAYSPLDRAKDTCFGLISENLHHKCVPLDFLRDIEIYEPIVPSILKKRIAKLKRWIMDQNMESLVLVGHSRYFHRLLDGDIYMWNCDIWQSAFVYDPSLHTGGMWHEPTLLFRSPLAHSYPIEGIFSALQAFRNNNGDKMQPSSTDVEMRCLERERRRQETLRRQREEAAARGNSSYEEPICRICQAKQSEMPDAKLFRPCKCAGSQAYVHLECLNQWRATSTAAYAQCSVCQYCYRIRKSPWAEWLMHPTVLVLLCFGLVTFAATLIGIFAVFLVDYWAPSYNSHSVADYMGINMSPSKEQCQNPQFFFNIMQHSVSPKNRFETLVVKTWIFVACNQIMSMVLRSFILGVLCVATVTYCYQLYLVISLRRDWMEGPQHLPRMVGVVSIWVSKDIRYSLRLFMVIGMMLTVSSLYFECSSQMRKHAHKYLGSVILDIDDED